MAASFIRAAEDELSCPICFELFVDPNTPKTLPLCGHICCEVCLKKMVAGKCARTCPECRKIIKIPLDGVASFPTNVRLRNLAEYIKKPGVRVCSNHEGEKMHYFCCTCNTIACQACLILKHCGDTHKIVGVKEKYEEQKIEMESAIAKTSHRIGQAEDMLRDCQRIKTQVKDSHKKIEQQIDDVISSHVNKLLDQGQRLKGQLQQAEQTKLGHLDQKLKIVAKKIEAAKTVKQVAVNALENAPDYEYITQHTSLIHEVIRLDVKEDVNFTPDAAAKFVPKQNINKSPSVGNIRLVYVTPGIERNLKLIQTLGGFHEACNVAKANGLLAVCEPRVTVYHKVNGKYEKKLNLDLDSEGNCSYAQDVAICPDGRFVVARGSRIEVYSPQGCYQNDIQTSSKNEPSDVRCVKVTPSGRILSADRYRSVVTEHDQTGNIVRTLKTSIKPYYMTLVNDTHIAVSDNYETVIVMNLASGQETFSIDFQRVKGICYDKQTECLLIARNTPALDTGVIEQYSYTTGKLVACLAQGLYHPHGMTITADGILAAANANTVKIYQIQ